MSIPLVVTRLGALLGAAPAAPVAAGRVSASAPTRASELPRVVVGIATARAAGVGLGRMVREGTTVGVRDDLVPVTAARGFSADLRVLDLPAMPLAEPPATVPVVTVHDVTDPARPLAYREAASPATTDEFRVDPARGQLRFGAAQRAGAVLAVRYRAQLAAGVVRARRLAGRLTTTLWAATAGESATLAAAVDARLADAVLARASGFWRLAPEGAEPAAPTRVDPLETPPFTAWRQQLTYAFTFEAEDEGSDGEGGVIRRIDVEMPGATPDALSVPAAATS